MNIEEEKTLNNNINYNEINKEINKEDNDLAFLNESNVKESSCLQRIKNKKNRLEKEIIKQYIYQTDKKEYIKNFF